MYGGGFGEKANPSGVSPEQDNESLVQKKFFQPGGQIFQDIVVFLPGTERQRHKRKASDGFIDLAQTYDRKHPRVQCLCAHQPHHIGFATLGAVRIDDQSYIAPACVPPFFTHFDKGLVKGTAAGCQSAQPDRYPGGRGCRRDRRE